MHEVLVVDALGERSKAAKIKRLMLALAVGLICLLAFLGLSVVLNFVVVDSLINTGTDNGRLTDKDTGAILKVAMDKMDVANEALVSSDGSEMVVGMREQTQQLPLAVLPVLADADLAAIREVVVTFRRANYVEPPHWGVMMKQTVALHIVEATRINRTYA